VGGNESLHRVRELREHGLKVELGPFGSRVLLDWREVARDDRPWDELASALPPEGVPDLERALWAIAVRPAQGALETVLIGRNGDPFVAPGPWLSAFDALVGEGERRLSWPATDARTARARFAERLSRWHALEGAAGAGSRRGECRGPAALRRAVAAGCRRPRGARARSRGRGGVAARGARAHAARPPGSRGRRARLARAARRRRRALRGWRHGRCCGGRRAGVARAACPRRAGFHAPPLTLRWGDWRESSPRLGLPTQIPPPRHQRAVRGLPCSSRDDGVSHRLKGRAPGPLRAL